MTTRHRLALIALLIALLLTACDDGGDYSAASSNPGDYPCSSAIARCVTPAP